MTTPGVPFPLYIALEGPEGCGKSTQAERLAAALGAVLTRETGGTAIGERLREILHDVTVTGLDARAEALIVAADRAQHIAEVVRPALAAGPPRRQRPLRVLDARLPGVRPRARRDEVRRINDWAMAAAGPTSSSCSTCPPSGARRIGRAASSTASSRPATTSTPGRRPGSGRWPPPTRRTGSCSTPAARSTPCAADPRRVATDRSP